MKMSARSSALAAFLLLVCPGVQCGEWSATADGVTGYFGVVPAQLARDTLPAHGKSERDPHGRLTATGGDHHFIVALFEAADGQRISEASVVAEHRADGGSAERKQLDAMRIGDTISFGNFFDLDARRRHEFTVEVTQPAHEQPIRLRFTYGPENRSRP